MFRTLARLIADPTLSGTGTPDRKTVEMLFAAHPVQLSRWLEETWASGGIAQWPTIPTVPLPGAALGPRVGLPAGLLTTSLQSGLGSVTTVPPGFNPAPPPALGVALGPLPWEHLMYCYLLESTGIVEIIREVVRRYVVGETLPPPSVDALVWVRATEELFFRDPPLFHVGGVSSQVRPDARVNRRNAYWRAFGFDLPHPVPGSTQDQPWKRDVGAHANTGFLELWNNLLRQVMIGLENDRNEVGANPTDSNYVAYLCQTLREILSARRRGGMLAREEFSYAALLNWCHLTVEYDHALLDALGATADTGGNPADRLAAVGARVGITPPRQSRELFELADIISPVMWMIEQGAFDDPANAEMLYRSFNGPTRPLPATMFRIIDLWQSATGERIKGAAVTGRAAAPARKTPTDAQPTRLPPAVSTVSLPQRVVAPVDGTHPGK